MTRRMVFIVLALAFIALGCAAEERLVWSDEFSGAAVSTGVWQFDRGNILQDSQGNPVEGAWGWGNYEQQYYLAKNAYVANGVLTVEAKRENYSDALGTCEYTSARLNTRNLLSVKYGRVEFRAQCDAGNKLWPALWMLPRDEYYGNWPSSGEIDIFEARGGNTKAFDATLHSGDASNNYMQTKSVAYPSGDMTAWHVYAVEWREDGIKWLLDGKEVYSLDKWNQPAGCEFPAPFDKPFYLIINLAVGGRYFGPDKSDWQADPSVFKDGPKSLRVDYVRVYDLGGGEYDLPQSTPVPTPTLTPTPDITAVSFDESALTLTAGFSHRLAARVSPEGADVNAFQWTSSKKKVAAVADGVIKALKPGKTVIKAASLKNPKISAACRVTVMANVFARKKPVQPDGASLKTSAKRMAYTADVLKVALFAVNKTQDNISLNELGSHLRVFNQETGAQVALVDVSLPNATLKSGGVKVINLAFSSSQYPALKNLDLRRLDCEIFI